MPVKNARPTPVPDLHPGAWIATLVVLFLLSIFVLHAYERTRDPAFGWSKLIRFGAAFEDRALPALKRSPHYVFRVPASRLGYDGQFYAQMAIDPTLRDPAFGQALDNPAYRGRRIGLPALAYALGRGEPGPIIQAYALANLLFWFALAIALLTLLKPWTWQGILCLAAALLAGGALTSMKQSLTDLPAAALIMIGLALGQNAAGYGAFAAATLTRETSLLAAFAGLDFRRPAWKRNARLLALATVPFALWFAYVKWRFGGFHLSSGGRNFSWPLKEAAACFVDNLRLLGQDGPSESARAKGMIGWYYADSHLHEMLTVVALGAQGVYLALRRDLASTIWRTGGCYLALGCVLGPAVWEGSGAAGRVLLPMTLCFYLRLARERRAGWFWPFFVLAGLAVPYGMHEFWLLH